MQGVDISDPIFGLDISAACIGWAIIKGPSFETGHITFGGKTIGQKLAYFRKWLFDIVQEYTPAVIANEQPFIGRPEAVANIYRFHGVFDERMSDFMGVTYPVHAPTWKSKVCGNGRISKADKEAGLVLELLGAKGYHVNHIDEGDALAVALCARVEMFGTIHHHPTKGPSCQTTTPPQRTGRQR